MGTSQNVELEAAKFLHKLIQQSKDEPTKLAIKLYVILQHMRTYGKENSMPCQVISRAMETVIKQHSLDMETLMSSSLTLEDGTQMGDSTSSQLAGGAVKVHGVSPGIHGASRIPEVSSVLYSSTAKEVHHAKMPEDRGIQLAMLAENEQDSKCLAARKKTDAEMSTEEAVEELHASAHKEPHGSSDQSRLEKSGWTVYGLENEISKAP